MEVPALRCGEASVDCRTIAFEPAKSGHRRSQSVCVSERITCHDRRCARSILSSGSQGGCGPAKQRSIVSKFNELPTLPRASNRRPDGLRKTTAIAQLLRPLHVLKAFYLGERRPKSGTPVQGRGIASALRCAKQYDRRPRADSARKPVRRWPSRKPAQRQPALSPS